MKDKKPFLLITSLQNPKIKQAVRLKKRNEREKTDLFIIEGYRELLRATEATRKIETLFICPDLFLGTHEPELINQVLKTGGKIIPCTKSVFEKISYRDRPDGLLGIAFQYHLSLEDFEEKTKTQSCPLLVAAEAIEKPGNLGTILRSADAVGADGVVVCDRMTDIHNPNVVRASVGTLFTMPVIEAEGERTLKWLKKRGIAIVAATPKAKQEFTQVDLTIPLAIAVGAEQLGLSQRWMKQATLQVKIPMYGVADSLNVAMATTLLMYEVRRQRNQSCINNHRAREISEKI